VHKGVPREPWYRGVSGAVALSTALLALVTAAVGIAFALDPSLRPDPRTRISGAVKVLAVEPGVTVESWLRRTSSTHQQFLSSSRAYLAANKGPSSAPLSRAQANSLLGIHGTILYVQTTIEGFKRRKLRLRWSVYQKRNGERVPDKDLSDIGTDSVNVNAPTDRSVQVVWLQPVAIPGRASSVFVRFELVTNDGAFTLAIADSPPIDAT
jgi:hypothetical protein